MRLGQRLAALTLLVAVPYAVGCASLVSRQTAGFAEDLYTAILDQNDAATVRDGAPAYLLAVDGLIAGSPDDGELLLTGARLYGAYAGAFVDDPARRERLWERALAYARRALCDECEEICRAIRRPFDEFTPALASASSRQVPVLYGFAATWAGWIEANAGDWNAVADLPKLEALMQRVLELDESYEQGGAHLYLGVLLTQRPASLGGQPEQGREHFERAIALSKGRNLMAKVLFARQYARLVFDRDLHDRLLREVVDANPEAPGLTLVNTLAREEAQQLLVEADDYF